MRVACICCGKEERAPCLRLKEPSQFPGGLNQSEDEIRERPLAQQEGGSKDAGSGTSARSSPPGGAPTLSKALYDRILLDITNMSIFGRTTCI